MAAGLNITAVMGIMKTTEQTPNRILGLAEAGEISQRILPHQAVTVVLGSSSLVMVLSELILRMILIKWLRASFGCSLRSENLNCELGEYIDTTTLLEILFYL
jgi:hypothetical protein